MHPPVPSEAETAVRALRVAWIANGIAVLALISGAASAYYTGQQADEAARANDAEQQVKALSVTLEAAPTGSNGPIQYSVVNRNKEPVLDVYYVYEVEGVEAEKDIFIGAIPGCSSVPVAPPAVAAHQRFRITTFSFRDPSGQAWRREASGALSKIEAPELEALEARTAGNIRMVEEC